ncbi:unnamed protein product [Candidula unifasciata]|uniref:BZIP domain-containing protein n=1 Tax=Candidula unifasciata TaxID=100452 RepID=A0A8S3YMY4_9EUPU|nr:unnamed protein product [Candidula unifasciata]
MLACDSGLQHRFTASTNSFARRFRADAYPDSRDLNVYNNMYTEGEPKDRNRRTDSASTPDSSPIPQKASHSCDVPPQLSPEVLPPASAAYTPQSTQPFQPSFITSAQSASPNGTNSSFSPPMQNSDEKSELHHTNNHHHHMQHHADRGDQLDRGHNSDSDSSSANGMGSDGNRRFREFVPDEQKNEIYWEKRRKNNEAARKSREKRRMQDMVMEGRITTLEDDNSKLRQELLALKKKFKVPEGQPGYETDSDESQQAGHRGMNTASPPEMNMGQTQHHNSVMGGISKATSNLPYSSPPPLLTMAESLPLGMAMYSAGSNAGLPLLLSEASRMNHDGPLKHISQSILQAYHPQHQHHLSPQNLHRSSYLLDMVKEEFIEEGEVRVRERSNSSIERRSAYNSDMSLLRRASVGNYSQYRSQLSPPSAPVSHHPYLSSHISPAHYLQRSYDSHPLSSWSERSPISSHSSDDNYDEPLQLTVRRDSSISMHSSIHVDESSREGDSNVTSGEKPSLPVSPPGSSLPLKLRHKIPSHDISYPKEMFPNISPAAVPNVTPSSYPTHPFVNGMAHLSDLTLSQANPLSLKVDSPTPYTQRKEARVGSRRSLTESRYMDPKYLERRRRNNEAARKCRENRKTLTKIREAKSDYLETENNKLRDELNSLQEEMKQLRELIEKKRLEQGIKDEPNVES